MKKRYVLIPALLVLALAAGIFLLDFAPEGYSPGMFPLYFFNASEGRLMPEYINIPEDDAHMQMAWLFNAFFGGHEPSNAALSRTWPVSADNGVLWTQNHLEHGVLTVNFSERYFEMLPLDEAVFRAAFTLTMTGLPQVQEVVFVPEGGGEITETAATIANDPFISPARRTAEEFMLFFVDETGEGLIMMSYVAENVDVHRRWQYIMRPLIRWQSMDGVMPLIPSETQVRNVDSQALGIYVDLSSEFVSRFVGTTSQAELMLQSITHTILENTRGSATRVFFLIDGVRVEEFHGITDFGRDFMMDETFMLDYIRAAQAMEEYADNG